MARDDQRHPALWGNPADGLTHDESEGLAALLRDRFPSAPLRFRPPVDPHGVDAPPARIEVPAALRNLCSTEATTRLRHASGSSFTDLVRARAGNLGAPPDVVATPANPAEVAAVLEWCADIGAACIPFGGGTSVVGGVNPPAGDRPVVTLQTRRMDRVLDVDRVSGAARIQAGAYGPRLEEQLRASDLTLRFYPQSFEYSTLGGWLATRAGGHFATGPTHIDDLVESITAITPAGVWESRRLPASGAGPSPDRMLLGSEGVLGVITEAWVRVQPRPEHRAGTTVRFPSFSAGAGAVRAIAQSGLRPAGCRLLDPVEAALNGAGDGSAAVLVLGFESVAWPVDADLAAAVELCRDSHGTADEARSATSEAGGNWRQSFLRAPYLRDALIGLGLIVETFETAITWDRFDGLVEDISAAASAAAREICGDAIVTCRVTHAYPDGAAPYFTVIAPGTDGDEAQQWAAIKQAASDALEAAAATITHHHAVGRDHRRWYDRQRPDVFAAAFGAAKRTVDPTNMLNPGVLLD